MTCFLESSLWHNKMLLHQVFDNIVEFTDMKDYTYDGKFSILIKSPEFSRYDSLAFITVYSLENVVTQRDLENIIELYKPYRSAERGSSVLVFDLDDTIIDENKNIKILDDKDEYYNMDLLRGYYDYIGIWSHGTFNHVDKYKTLIKNFNFDFFLNRFNDYQGPKYVMNVLKTLNITKHIDHIKFACLVDDTSNNFFNDYDIFIKISKHKKIKLSQLVRAIHEETVKILQHR